MNQTQPDSPVTQPHVVLVVIYSLAILSALGFLGTFLLVREKVDGASIAVFSGLTGTVLGGLMSALNNTRTNSPATDAAAESEDQPRKPALLTTP
jgi:hypothetical protein